MVEPKKKKVAIVKQGRYQYGSLRVFVNGVCKGNAYVNLVIRKNERFYIVANVYEWGRWPHFTRRGGSESLLIELPKAVVLRMAKRLSKRAK